MKKMHIILILALAGTAALLLKETQALNAREANLAEELAMLRQAVKHAPAAVKPLTSKPYLDAGKVIAELQSLLSASDEVAVKTYFTQHEAQLAAAPASQLKEICAWLEQHYPIASPGKSLAHMVWGFVARSAAKSDPAWAIATFERAASARGTPTADLLPLLKSIGGEPLSPHFAAALQKWLDAVTAAGRLEPANPLAAELRTGIAAAQGNQSAAVKEIIQMPHSSQRDAAIHYAKTLSSPDESRRALEELSTGLKYQNYQKFVRSLAASQGFDAAREALASAALSPEHHDLALASIAGASIGPETKERATWLLASLRSEDHRALQDFAAQWSQGDHTAAATWANTLPTSIRRDAALRGLIPVAARIDGATAMDWALTVSDPRIRNQLYSEAHAKWSETDATRADAYRQAKPLDQEALMAAGQP